jgi:hypothetical protein
MEASGYISGKPEYIIDSSISLIRQVSVPRGPHCFTPLPPTTRANRGTTPPPSPTDSAALSFLPCHILSIFDKYLLTYNGDVADCLSKYFGSCLHTKRPLSTRSPTGKHSVKVITFASRNSVNVLLHFQIRSKCRTAMYTFT